MKQLKEILLCVERLRSPSGVEVFRCMRMYLAAALIIGSVMSWPIALVQAQEVRSYFISDAVGSPVMATDAYANVTWSEDYYRTASDAPDQ